jgi:hypothetical protein
MLVTSTFGPEKTSLQYLLTGEYTANNNELKLQGTGVCAIFSSIRKLAYPMATSLGNQVVEFNIGNGYPDHR